MTIVVVALVADGHFRWAGLAPEPLAGEAGIRRMDDLAWDYTTSLCLVFPPLVGTHWWAGSRAE